MNVIHIDDLQAAVNKAIQGVAKGIRDAECNTGLTVRKPYKLDFSFAVATGINAIERLQQTAPTTRTSTAVEAPIVEKTTRTGSQDARNEQNEESTGTEVQKATSTDATTQNSKGTSTEKGTSKGTSKNVADTARDGSTTADESSSDDQSVNQAQTQGTTTTTTTDYTS